ncbi:hypothetical protein Lalb_Chr14g0369241 [Lupinus albus]|uniref:Uncharacterized protein n=1 Tax=Lupinus albus TaxID=3870 RepID=A0A6A4PEW7_LUPAL|nr:hypothetical protein Lalb_Chr14g0369241 [Lupinus albus]
MLNLSAKLHKLIGLNGRTLKCEQHRSYHRLQQVHCLPLLSYHHRLGSTSLPLYLIPVLNDLTHGIIFC